MDNMASNKLSQQLWTLVLANWVSGEVQPVPVPGLQRATQEAFSWALQAEQEFGEMLICSNLR